MADVESRIRQFEKMANDDPNNELGHLSLGKAYLDAGRAAEAVTCFDRAAAVNPGMSKAYQLAATALLQAGKCAEAVERLTRGVQVADERGEMMPRGEMVQTLKDLGAPVPDLKNAAAPAPVAGEGEVLCQRCHRLGRKLPKPPFSNAQGREIFEKVCMDCWREWIGMGTKVINEMRLPLNDPQAQKIYDQHMKEFLNLG